MNLFLLYLLLFKAVITSFSGMASLPVVRQDFVVTRHVLTDRQLNTAIVAGRTGPGPNGLYLVSVGYFAGGLPGAFAGFIALITPAFLVIPLMSWIGKYASLPRIRSAIRAVILASAGLLMAASIPLARDAATGPVAIAIILASFFVLTFTRVETWRVMIAAAAIGLSAKLFG
ncbi:MAG: chromate transporter [Acidobacteriota bacterium]|nr:chromate transporter [Acidobacteriota bacterium]